MSAQGSPIPLPPLHSPTHTPRLRPAVFGEQQGSAPNMRPHANPAQRGLFDDEPGLHWSLAKQINPSKYLTLFSRLPHKLSATNYISWMFAVEATLDTIDLLGYVNGEIPTHTTGNNYYVELVL